MRKQSLVPVNWSEWGVETVCADVTRPSQLEAVFAGECNAAYWAVPNSPERVQLTLKFLEACIQHGIDFPVVISALGVGEEGGGDMISQFAEVESVCRDMAGKRVKEQFWDKGGFAEVTGGWMITQHQAQQSRPSVRAGYDVEVLGIHVEAQLISSTTVRY